MYMVLMERAAHRRQSSLEINPYHEFLLFIFHPGEEYSTKFLTRRNPPRGPIPYSFNPFSYTFIDKNSISFNCCKCTVVYIRASVNRFGPFYKRSWEISLSVSYTVHTLQVLKSLPLVPEAWKWYLFRAEPPRIGVSPLPASPPPPPPLAPLGISKSINQLYLNTVNGSAGWFSDMPCNNYNL